MVFVGVVGAAVGVLQRCSTGGRTLVVLRNADLNHGETVSIVEVGESGNNVLASHAPITIGPGAASEVRLVPQGDTALQLLFHDAAGVVRRFRIGEYVTPAIPRTIWIEFAGGRVVRARARSERDEVEHEVAWRPD